MTSVLGLVLISMSACLMPKSVPQGLGATPEGHPVEVEHQQRWQRKVDKLPFREAHLHTRRTLHGTVGGGLEGGPVVDSLRVGRSRVSRVLAHRGGASADLGGANKTVGRSNARGRPVGSQSNVRRFVRDSSSASMSSSPYEKQPVLAGEIPRRGRPRKELVHKLHKKYSERDLNKLYFPIGCRGRKPAPEPEYVVQTPEGTKIQLPNTVSEPVELNPFDYNATPSINKSEPMLDRPFQCKICGKAYMKKGHLMTHRFVHNAERHVCKICNRSFNFRFNLIRHLKMHSGLRPYVCTVCNHAFNLKGNLQIHFRVHTKMKPYTCSQCNRAFTMKQNRDTHYKTHINTERPYKCSMCDKGFVNKDSLNTHIKVHSESKWKCPYCTLGFSAKFRLETHVPVCKQREGHRDENSAGVDLCNYFDSQINKQIQIFGRLLRGTVNSSSVPETRQIKKDDPLHGQKMNVHLALASPVPLPTSNARAKES